MPRYLIQTPVKGASTDIGPVHFHQGKAELDEVPHWLRQYCTENGYSITDTQALEESDGDDDGNPATPPPGNAKAEVWRDHVLALAAARPDSGVTEDQVRDLTRDQLRELAATLGQTGQEGQQS